MKFHLVVNQPTYGAADILIDSNFYEDFNIIKLKRLTIGLSISQSIVGSILHEKNHDSLVLTNILINAVVTLCTTTHSKIIVKKSID